MKIQLETILGRILAATDHDEDLVHPIMDGLERMLEELRLQNAFGTSGQLDPRGNFENGDWSVWEPEE